MKKVIASLLLFTLMTVSFAFCVSAEEETDVCYAGLPRTYAENFLKSGSTAGAKSFRKSRGGAAVSNNDVLFAERLLTGWQSLASRIMISDLEISVSKIDEMAELYFRLARENPRLYYIAKSFNYSKNYLGIINYIFPVYTETDTEAVNAMLEGIDEETENAMFMINSNMSEFEKAMTIHDYIVLNYEYDSSEITNDASMMVTKRGMCESYALVFKLLADKAGINCTFVSSDEMEHIWNLVMIDGEWYHVDATWDDPLLVGIDENSITHHNYSFLSTDRLQSLEKPHYSFDLGGVYADSYLYDNAAWHDSTAAVVYLNGDIYYTDGTSLKKDDGSVIFSNLDGGDGYWNAGANVGFAGSCYAGLAEYNGKLYFSTDTEIRVYDPSGGEIRTEYNIPYTFGLYVDKNTLNYSYPAEYQYYDEDYGETYDVNVFVPGGSFILGNLRFGEAYISEGNAVIKILKENNETLYAFQGANGINGLYDFRKEIITKNGITTVSFPKNGSTVLYFWDSDLTPVREKILME